MAVKKISGEYFKENRDFIPLSSIVKEKLAGSVEKKRLDTARKYMELSKNQKESRARIFKAYGVDMPLPDITEAEYLDRIVPMDAWLYSQYGAILYPQEDGSTKISEDGALLIIDLEVKGKTLAEINGVPTRKEETPTSEKEPVKEPVKKAAPRPAAGQPKENPVLPGVPDPGAGRDQIQDILAPNRERAARYHKKVRRISLVRKGIFWTVALLFAAVGTLMAYRFFFRGL